ncbi:filamentous hemagglutinin N-terminal domain-containing protein [Scytonema sp. NUACC26]|uniref:two-partner secretion domain-containing protein n=1 Tax=Scytonema sp. NUACC26 TaxID=3140176 RepID=UPI0034DC0C8D
MLGLVLRRASFQRSWYWQFLTSSVFFTGTVAVWDCAHAQLVTDTTLGNESSIVTPNVVINGIVSDRIDGGAIRGINLFHSFSEFNVGEGRGIYFSNPSGTENILSRVTGNNPSNILGTLGVTGGNANLFLINPNGIIFGTNGSLDVKGSFVATTANGVQFDNLGFFSATNPEAPSSLLTINPRALFFNQINQNAAIQNSSIAPAGIDPAGFNALGLRVPDGKSLLLVGGNVRMDGGKLNAYGGRVELGGLATPGNVNLLLERDNLRLGFPDNVARTNVLLTNQAAVYVEGAGGGNIAINARNIEILKESVLSAGIGRGLGTPETVAGDITLNATGEIKVAGSKSGIGNLVRLGAKGNGGNIIIDSGSFSLRDGAQLVASTFGQGNAGNVTVQAKDAVSLEDGSILSTVEAGGVGKGGNIDISAATLSLIDSAQLLTFTREASDTQRAGQGDAGNVNVKVTGIVDIAGEKDNLPSGILSSVATGTVGNGGNITIDSGSFSLRDGARLATSTSGQGNAGNVTVSAKGTVSLVDGGILSTVEAGGVGKGGNIDINATSLSLTDASQLLTITRGASATQLAGRGDAGNVNVKVTGVVEIAGKKNGFLSEIFSGVGTGAKGNGGDITINSNSLLLRDSARLEASTYGQGNAGNVTVQAKDAVSLVDGNIFSTVETSDVGKGGNIDINAASLTLRDGTRVFSSTYGQGNAGNINVKVTGIVDIAGEKNGFLSEIFSGVGTGVKGNGGDITINSNSLLLRDSAQLRTSTYGQGNAGNVTVQAKDAISLVDGNIFSTVEASGVGKGGNIDINAASLTLRDGARVFSSTYGQGNAGNVKVKVTGIVDIAGEKNGFLSEIFSGVGIGARGNGGDIAINSNSLLLRDSAQLGVSTYGQGNAGNVTVQAKDAVFLAGNAYILNAVEAGGVGKGGNIDINAAMLTLTDGAQLITITRGASDIQPAGRGDAGNVNIDVMGAVTITGRNGTFSSGIQTGVETGTTGNAGNVTINSSSFFLTGGAAIFTGTDGKGNAGDVTVNARESVLLRDPDNAIFSTVLENGEGTGGNIEINTASFSILNAAGVTAETRGQGNAGNVKINATDSVTISGKVSEFTSGLYASSFAGASGRILGDAGNIEVNSPKVTLDNSGTINAESTSGNGGNININSNLLLLRRGAQISATAGTAEKGGDGGNININSKFIVAVPNENSDLTANAFTGRGGNINIRSQGIFGIEARPKASDITNDITASSNFGSSGIVDVFSPDNSSIQNNLAELSQTPIDTNALIANSCIVRSNSQKGTFIITGSDGLPYRPGDISVSTYPTGDVRNVQAENVSRPWQKGDPIVEPSGVFQLTSGQLVLSRKCSQ